MFYDKIYTHSARRGEKVQEWTVQRIPELLMNHEILKVQISKTGTIPLVTGKLCGE